MQRFAVFRIHEDVKYFLLQFHFPPSDLHVKLSKFLKKNKSENLLQQNSSGKKEGRIVILGYESRTNSDSELQNLIILLKSFCKLRKLHFTEETLSKIEDDDETAIGAKT
ncbi:MAG TPA: hypothetical protein PKD34_00695 [Candidatus Doudnabacteria bacterium]|nr:hypothetical protein [Candidatus Doudnabacteria bacterium]